MYRVRSTDVWFNAPGVVAAYQPVAAPGPLLARYNVGNDARMAGKYTATSGVEPTWNPLNGWTFSAASTQYFSTGVTPEGGWSAFCRFSGSPNNDAWLIGSIGSNQQFGLRPNSASARRYRNGGDLTISGVQLSGVMAFAGQAAYLNGSVEAGTIGTALGSWRAIDIGRLNAASPSQYLTGNIQAVAICSAILTPAHVAQYSRQITYCHVNPDWSAWGRRRRYYYAPSASAFALWRGVGRNSSPVGGSPGIGRTP